MFQSNEDRIVKSLESIAESQIKMAQIAEQSFKEAKELRDITMGMMKKDLELEKEITDQGLRKLLKSKDKPVGLTKAQLEDIGDEEDDDMPF